VNDQDLPEGVTFNLIESSSVLTLALLAFYAILLRSQKSSMYQKTKNPGSPYSKVNL
jgi:hypothetical protein